MLIVMTKSDNKGSGVVGTNSLLTIKSSVEPMTPFSLVIPISMGHSDTEWHQCLINDNRQAYESKQV